MPLKPRQPRDPAHRERRRLRLRRHGRRAYIRSVYSLPSLATLGNAICGFGAMYVCTLDASTVTADPVARWFLAHRFVAAAYLIFVAMLFDALDGRLARMARHTTDFGGQLDSMADVISFGAAPAFLALQVFREHVITGTDWFPPVVSRLIWAAGALYMSCAAIRLARFNVSNEHGEQHHFSFLGLPSPGAGAVVAALVLMQQDLHLLATYYAGGANGTAGAVAVSGATLSGATLTGANPTLAGVFRSLSTVSLWAMPPILVGAGLLMTSNIRYPHLVNRYLRGRRSLGQLLLALGLLLGLFVAHRYVIGIGTLLYTLSGLAGSTWGRLRGRAAAAAGRGDRPTTPPTVPDAPRAT